MEQSMQEKRGGVGKEGTEEGEADLFLLREGGRGKGLSISSKGGEGGVAKGNQGGK